MDFFVFFSKQTMDCESTGGWGDDTDAKEDDRFATLLALAKNTIKFSITSFGLMPFSSQILKITLDSAVSLGMIL